MYISKSVVRLGLLSMHLPKEVFLRTQDQIMNIVCMALAGRAVEEIFLGRVTTTGSSDDLKRVTDLVFIQALRHEPPSRAALLS